MSSKATNGRLFWEWVETAWAMIPNADRVRAGILSGETVDVEQALLPTIAALALLAEGLTVDGLRVFCSEFDRHMYLLDREELAKHMEYGDDGFMDARATIILLGEAHYRAVTEDFRVARKCVGVEKAALRRNDGVGEAVRRHAPVSAVRVLPRGTGEQPGRLAQGCASARSATRASPPTTDDLAKQLGVGRRGLRVAAKDGVTVTLPNLAPDELSAVLFGVARKLSPKGG